MITYTNKELTAQVQDLKEQLAKATGLTKSAKHGFFDLGVTAKEVGRRIADDATAEVIYKAYPRKIGKGAAIKAIVKALNKGVSANILLHAVNEYSDAIAWQQNRSLIPHPATWFNQERWEDDPKEWEQPTQGNQGPDPTRSILG